MYALYYIFHLGMVFCLLFYGIALVCKAVVDRSGRRRRSNPANKLLSIGFVALFGSLIAVQYNYQSGGNLKFAGMRTVYDKREWRAERYMKKGAILDRSGLTERALAISYYEDGKYIRKYPSGNASGHILGYSSRQRGRSGIEAVFVSELIGNESGSVGNWYKNFMQKLSNPVPEGSDIVLTIDSRLQEAAFNAFNDCQGAAVVMAPETGEILALVSVPGFSPADALADTAWSALVADTTGTPFFNRAISGLYPPGSIFKIITAAAAIENDLTPEVLSGPEGFLPEKDTRPVHEHEYEEYSAKGLKWTGHGRIDIETSFKKSSNVYFASVGTQLGEYKMSAMTKNFGIGEKVNWNTASFGLESWFPVKKSSFSKLKSLTMEQLAWSSIGQFQVLITPLQMALVTSSIANGGRLVMPSLELGRFPKYSKKTVSAGTAEKLRKMMRETVNGGTGFRANVPGIRVAGKTGTAENAVGQPHSWFASFAPYDNPKIVVVVLVENGGYGSVAAAKIARKIFSAASQSGYFEE